MPESLRLIPATSPEWSEWLAGVPHDFFHTAGHHRVWEENGSGSAWMAVYGSRGRSVAWPYLLRPIELDASAGTGLFDITSVDGYAGPLLDGCVAGECFTSAAIDAIFHQWQELGVVSAFARFHPLLENHRAVPDTGVRLTDGETRSIHFQGHTVSIDLQLEAAKAQSLYRESHLRQIRRSRRAGLAIAPDDSPRGFADFVRLYHQTMRRNHADQHYFFSERFLKGLRDTLGEHASIHLARIDDRTVGAVFITELDGIVQYLLGGVEENTQSLSPLKALLDGVREWARQRGNRVLHLGGGRGCQDTDPLFYFKAGFSPQRHRFYTGRWIVDRPRYAALVDAYTRHAAQNQCVPDRTGYFPAYRTPLVSMPSEQFLSLA